MTWRVCSNPGCPELHEGRGRCPRCRAEADAKRTSGKYTNTRGHRSFREAVLARDPICVLCYRARSTVADHYPHERADLIDMGLDPNGPEHGRGLCASCHSRRTARDTPGGWNNRT